MAGLALLALAACSPESAPPVRAPHPSAAAVDPALVARVNAINHAAFVASPQPPPAPTSVAAPPDPLLVKAETLLARNQASPGQIDGLAGSNLKRALAAYEAIVGLPVDGELSDALWSRLAAPGQPPAAGLYVVTAQDAAGPFYPDVGEDLVAASKLPAMGYSRPAEMLAERFHMSEGLLLALNPGADFAKAGTPLVVVQPLVPALPRVDHVEIDKAKASVRAYDQAGAMLASLPATVGSTERPSPSGVRKVVGVSLNPTYTYDPAKLTWGPRRHGRFIVRPGPNNPVGSVWIDLNAPGYGIHGSPAPDKIGKTASHGCVRLTNWDATLLAHAVRPGVKVAFVHQRGG